MCSVRFGYYGSCSPMRSGWSAASCAGRASAVGVRGFRGGLVLARYRIRHSGRRGLDILWHSYPGPGVSCRLLRSSFGSRFSGCYRS
jgi:hypothetical protein